MIHADPDAEIAADECSCSDAQSTDICSVHDGGAPCIAGGNEELTFAPAICPASARLLEDSAQMPGRFLQRQRFFYDLKQQRMRVLQAEVLSSWLSNLIARLGSASTSPGIARASRAVVICL